MSPEKNMETPIGARSNGKGESISKPNCVLLYNQYIMSCGAAIVCRVNKQNIKEIKEINKDGV